VRDINIALGHHVNQITITELVCDIPTDADNDDCAVEVAAAKQGRCVWKRRLIHANVYQPKLAFAPVPVVAAHALLALIDVGVRKRLATTPEAVHRPPRQIVPHVILVALVGSPNLYEEWFSVAFHAHSLFGSHS
jgi:hypothetical protein